MTIYKVNRVAIRGPQLIGAKRSPILKSRAEVEIHTNRGTTTARLNDFQDVSLEPSLDPASYVQTFVCGPVLERAKEVLNNVPEVRERMQPNKTEEIDFANLASQGRLGEL